MKKFIVSAVTLVLLLTPLTACQKQENKTALDPKNPTDIVVWHYYNGQQQDAFSKLVLEFNQTVGTEKGIQLEEVSQGDVSDLENSIYAASEGKVNAEKLPTLFAGYASTVYQLDKKDLIADISPYFTDDELNLYIDGYIEEGRFDNNSTLKIFPIAKSTELFFMNLTDWNVFADATGASIDTLSTFEGVTETARKYYQWTDSLTPDIANDGSAFYGRDAFANYMIIGSKQLGADIFTVQDGVPTLSYEKDVVRKLWDNYYTPMVAGWYAAENRFRSDDAKLGTILACVGSSTSAAYFPTTRIVSDSESYPIETYTAVAPQFANGESYAVQQGAGFAVIQASEAEIEAATVFLKWFSEPQRNSIFAVESAYLPVTKEASTVEYLANAIEENTANQAVAIALTESVKTTETSSMYTTPAFLNGASARALLENAMPNAAAKARTELLERVAQGEDYNQVLSELTSDEVFENWYATSKDDLLKSLEN